MTAAEDPERAPTASVAPRAADVVVVGAGIVGLATAHSLLAARPALDVVVVDKEPDVAIHQSGRNSGVLHSGIYYAPGSLKARTARVGRAAMLAFCDHHAVSYRLCGKVIVATAAAELGPLDDLLERARSNGVTAERIGPERLAEIEPHAAGLAALWVPEAGIVDYRAVCGVLRREVEAAGGRLSLATTLTGVVRRGDDLVAETDRGAIVARGLVNCAGLQSDRVARLDAPIADGTHIVPFRGEYHALRLERRSLVRALIYPVPDPRLPFLGVHLTTTLTGVVLAGPNAVLALAREGYRWRDVDPRQLGALAVDRGLWRLGARYWRTAAGEVWRSLSKAAFTRALQRLVPALAAADLEPYPAGVRAQALRPDGGLVDDFALMTTERAVHVLNAPSPAATASLEIGRVVAVEALARLSL